MILQTFKTFQQSEKLLLLLPSSLDLHCLQVPVGWITHVKMLWGDSHRKPDQNVGCNPSLPKPPPSAPPPLRGWQRNAREEQHNHSANDLTCPTRRTSRCKSAYMMLGFIARTLQRPDQPSFHLHSRGCWDPHRVFASGLVPLRALNYYRAQQWALKFIPLIGTKLYKEGG